VQGKVYPHNPYTLDKLKQSILETIVSIKVSEVKVVSIFSSDLNFKSRRKTFKESTVIMSC
jgi:hypothetical protein